MICLQRREGWDVVFQRAHAYMAARLLHSLPPDPSLACWPELLAATAQHDNGWTEWEPSGRLSPSGAPMDFEHAPMHTILEQAQRVCALGWHQDSAVGWLISRHMHQLYDPVRAQHQAFDTWLTDQADLRSQRARACDHSAQALERAYALMLWADTLSLTLCKETLPFGGRWVQLDPDHRGQSYRARRLERLDVVELDPWPFETPELQVSVDHRSLSALTYDDYASFLKDVQATVPQRRTFHLRPGPALPHHVLEHMTLAQLRRRAQHAGLQGRSSMNKQALLDALKRQEP